jgi:aminoglycoside phosphotransferase (APT) family kinase protein
VALQERLLHLGIYAVGPHNTVYRGGRPVAFIDWDFAAPAPREWDIAYALWRFVPLYDDRQCAGLGWRSAGRLAGLA